MAGSYDKAMRSVQAKTGATAADMERLTAQSREMGRTMVHSATDAAEGQAFLAQAGFDVNEVLSALPGTLNLATAGELSLGRAADIASNVLTGFNLNVSEANRVADVLALTAQSTNTNVQQMGDAMKYAASVAAAADADFEETAAAIGLLANAGFQGSMGGTALRGAMSKLLNPTKAAQKILDKLGISAVTSTGSLKPLHEIVGQFEDAGLTAGDAMKIFGQRAGPGMLALVSQGSGALVELTAELKNAEGTAQKTADHYVRRAVGCAQKVPVHHRISIYQLWRTVGASGRVGGECFCRSTGTYPGSGGRHWVDGRRYGRPHARYAEVVWESRAASAEARNARHQHQSGQSENHCHGCRAEGRHGRSVAHETRP